MNSLILVFGFIAQLPSSSAAGPTSCALEVLVKSPSGATVPAVSVIWLNETLGFEFKTTTDRQGMARFCDPSINARFTARVGNGVCALTVHEIPQNWKETRRIEVIYQDCKIKEMFGFCHVLLRVHDQQNQPLLGAELTLQSAQPLIQGSFLSDRFGRIYLSIGWGITSLGVLQLDGYSKQTLKLECEPKSSTSERIEILRPGPP